MARFIIDTSAYSRFVAGDGAVKKWFSATNELVIPFVTIAELKAGFVNGSRTAENMDALNRFLVAPNVEVLSANYETTDMYADIFVELRQAGKALSMNDIWIAALCRQNDLPLLTADNDFKHVSGLELL